MTEVLPELGKRLPLDIQTQRLPDTVAEPPRVRTQRGVSFLSPRDPDGGGTWMLANERGLLTFTDYKQLYDPRYSIHLIITLTPDQNIFDDISIQKK